MKRIAVGLLLAAASVSTQAESGASAELMVGLAEQTTDFDGYESTSGDDVSVGVRGIYSFNQNFALEVAFQDYGEIDDTYIDEYGDTINDRVATSALTAGMKGSIPLQSGLTLSARLGLASWDLDYRGTDSAFPGEIFSASDDGSDLYYGAGLQFDLNQVLYIGAEYTITEMGLSIASADHEVSNLSIFVGYSF